MTIQLSKNGDYCVCSADDRPEIDPGKLRGLQRVASDDGFLEIRAFLDHLSDFADFLAPDPKLGQLWRRCCGQRRYCTCPVAQRLSVLARPPHGLQTVATGNHSIPVGLMVSVEDEDTRFLPDHAKPGSGPGGARVK